MIESMKIKIGKEVVEVTPEEAYKLYLDLCKLYNNWYYELNSEKWPYTYKPTEMKWPFDITWTSSNNTVGT